jgi:hypothetical protein
MGIMDSSSKGPHPWLSPALTLVAIFIAIAWAYIQMLHWREPEADYVSLGANILVTVGLWVAMSFAIIAHYRSIGANRASEESGSRLKLGLGILLVSMVVISAFVGG